MLSFLLEIIIILALISLNGFFALSEIALISAKKSRLRQAAKRGDKRAQNALYLARRPSETLSAIQIGITTIGIIAGVIGGVTIAERIEEYFVRYNILTVYSESISVFIVVIIITYLSLIIGELVPKQIALSNPEKHSLIIAGPIRFISRISKPIINILSYSSNKILKMLNIKEIAENTVSEEEVKLLIAEGIESGAFEKSEQKMVENIFHIGNRPIRDFITPKDEIVFLNLDDSIYEMKKKIASSDQTSFLVYKNEKEKILGAVEANDILVQSIDTAWKNFNLKTIIQEVSIIEDNLPALIAIEKLQTSNINIALIKDKESHEIIGLISFHDVLEAIVGGFKISQ